MKNDSEELEKLRSEIEMIKMRNIRVEADKAWETSKTRTVFIATSTYVLIFIFMWIIRDKHPFLNAFIASIGYFISTLTYDILKKWWLQRRHSNT